MPENQVLERPRLAEPGRRDPDRERRWQPILKLILHGDDPGWLWLADWEQELRLGTAEALLAELEHGL